MGASVRGYWKGITKEQLESQPGFGNDCKAWGNWMAKREGHPDVVKAVRKLGAAALLVCKTDGMLWFKVKWTTPRDLAQASRRLREIVATGDPKTKRILETYAAYGGVEDAKEEFAQDLHDIEQLALFAESQGVQKMTIEVNW
jgi:hypothetical protein